MSGDFLSRWSRLKSEAAKPEVPAAAEDVGPPVDNPDTRAAEATEPVEDAARSEPELTEEEVAALPPVEELTGASDIGPFLRAGVPALLRNAALRRIWTVDPAIRDFVDDAREYAYDWNTPGGVPGLGPLLPSDDVKAMVRRIFDGPCSQAQEKAAGSDDEAAAQQADARAPEALRRMEPDEIQPPIGSAELAPASPPRLTETAASAVHAAPNASAGAPQPFTARRSRRHGGATPA